MFHNKMQELIDIIDENKDNLSNHDYMHICKLMKDIYNNHEDDIINSNDDIYRLDYHDSKFIKHFLNILSIITSTACMILMYIHMHNIAKLIVIHS
jgi:hypothetical protein